MIIETNGLKKIYRTEEVETTALDMINLNLMKGSSSPLWDLPVAASPRC